MTYSHTFRHMIDDNLNHGSEYDDFIKMKINGKFTGRNPSRGGYLVFTDEKGEEHKFYFFDKYESFFDKVDINDSIKKEANKKEFTIIKVDTSIRVNCTNTYGSDYFWNH